VKRKRLLAQGIVQGVGFRPAVFRLAEEFGLVGWVQNTSRGVVIEIQGPDEQVEAFIQAFPQRLPPQARLEALQTEEIPPLVPPESAFTIRASRVESDQQAFIPPDIATCAECMAEVLSRNDRRAGYPFTNCTNCGPRFTIIKSIPYDRPATTMASFTMCPECQAEYDDPRNRRFHAQPNACPVCGPHVAFDGDYSLGDAASLKLAGKALQAGKIIAIKGLGGYHLACDASNPEAVNLLRERKRRRFKAFAVMCKDLETARLHARLSPDEEALLLSPAAPIVLVEKRPDSTFAPSIAPNNRWVGLLLPYTPLHRLLFEYAPPALVMTSGNLAEEPLVADNAQAEAKLGRFVDHFLHHNRPIEVPCDDSVVRLGLRGLQFIRRSRGYVPRAISLQGKAKPALGCGAEWKNTFCLLYAGQAVMSQHIGDLNDLDTYDYYQRALAHLERLLKVKPEVVGFDLHLDYLASRFARSLEGVELVPVQHHHAHIASVQAEHSLKGPVLGLACDGTGYGADGTSWGCEALLCEGKHYERLGHLQPVRLPGGDAAIKHPVRTAYSYLYTCFGEAAEELSSRLGLGLSPALHSVLKKQLQAGVNAPLASGLGRLFDAVSALLGICREAEYEGQPALELESATGGRLAEALPFVLEESGDRVILEPAPLIKALVEARLAGRPVAELAAAFHATVVEGLAALVLRLAERTGVHQVALSGGSFQNQLLLEHLPPRLEARGLQVYLNAQVPPNDGGLALGQAWLAGVEL